MFGRMASRPSWKVLVMSTVTGALLVASAPIAAAGAQEGPFSTNPVSVPDPNVAPAGLPQLLAVDVGQHDGFDRVVFRFSSRAPGYNITYATKVTADPSDQPVAVKGNVFITVALHSVASGNVGAPAAPQGRQTPNFPQLKEVVGIGDFEGTVSFALGLESKSGFRASVLTGPDRLVIDVKSGGTLVASGAPVTPFVVTGLGLLVLGLVVTGAGRRRARHAG
jgi:hypothetical protein